jgi:hypothetical protein
MIRSLFFDLDLDESLLPRKDDPELERPAKNTV